MKVLEQCVEYVAAKHRIVAGTPQFGKSLDEGADPGVRIFRVQRVARVDAGVGEHASHVQLRRRVRTPKMRVEGGELLGRPGGPDEVVAPGARFREGARAAFEVLRLDLRVLAEREEDVEHVLVVAEIQGRCLLDGKSADDHGERHGEVIRIDRGLVDVGGPLTG